MNELIYKKELIKTRSAIARRVRELRKERRWTQAELAERLDLSQARLSEIERGDGSFSAEQLLLILRLFNVGVDRFVANGDASNQQRSAALQNVLARLGALHLHESTEALPSERLGEVRNAVREALVVADSSRLVTALAPVLVVNADRLNLHKLQLELNDAGLPRRLPWLVENVLDALAHADAKNDSAAWARSRRRAVVLLQSFLEAVRTDSQLLSEGALDILDTNIRSKQTHDEVVATSSPISRRWRIVTGLQAKDFAHALASARAIGGGRGRH